MKKIHVVLRTLLLVTISIIALTLLFADSCGSVCEPYSIFNPFGIVNPTDGFAPCPDGCAWRPHPLFYITFNIFILTIIIYITTLIISKNSKSNNKVSKV